MASTDGRTEEIDVVAALRESAAELDRMLSALEEAERELGAAEAALREGPGPEVRRAVEALLPELGPAVVLDADDRVIACSDGADVPGPAELAGLARAARVAAPATATDGPRRAVAVGRAAPLVVVLLG